MEPYAYVQMGLSWVLSTFPSSDLQATNASKAFWASSNLVSKAAMDLDMGKGLVTGNHGIFNGLYLCLAS